VKNKTHTSDHKTILVISPWSSIWSMGKEAGVSDDYYFIETAGKRNVSLHFLVPKETNTSDGTPGYTTHTYTNFFKATKKLPTWLKRFFWPFLFQLFVLPKAVRLARSLKPDFILGHSHYTSLTTHISGKAAGVPFGVKLFGVMDLVHMNWSPVKYYFKNFEQILAMKVQQKAWIILDDGTRGKEAALRLGVRENTIHFLPNGINIEWSSKEYDRDMLRNGLGIPPGACVILFLARLVRSKRLDLLIRALPGITKQACKQFLVLVVGDGPERERCEALARQLGVTDHIRFHGGVTHHRVAEMMSASDIFVSTSSLTNMAIPTCEAFLCGLPAVGFDVGDTAKIIKNGETGYAITDGDVPALERAVSDLINDADQRRLMGQNAKRFASEHFMGWEERTNAEFDIILSLIEQGM